MKNIWKKVNPKRGQKISYSIDELLIDTENSMSFHCMAATVGGFCFLTPDLKNFFSPLPSKLSH